MTLAAVSWRSAGLFCGVRLFATACLLAMATGASHADSAVLVLPIDLRSEPEAESGRIARLAQDSRVEVLGQQGGWVRVDHGGLSGWLPALSLRRDSGLADTGGRIRGPGQKSVIGAGPVAGPPRNLPVPRSTSHALIMAIGAYRDPIPALKGVRHDAESARMLANGLGVPPENVRVHRDGELTLDGMRKAFEELESRIGSGDDVFVYYSGHGTRTLRREGSGERCAEDLLAVDGRALSDVELEERLGRLANKARRVRVFIDACHSGGATTRSPGPRSLTAKGWTAAATVCRRPSNVLTRDIVLSSFRPGSGATNFVHIAASRADEVALDDPGKGGLATQAWLECMGGAAQDQDGSGGLSVDEIRHCAQAWVDAVVAKVEGYTTHHLTLTGNQKMVFAATADAAPAAASAKAAIQDLHAGRDDRRQVKLIADKSRYRIGRDPVGFTVQSSHDGYLYLLMVGSDGRSFDLLFPNRKDGENFIRAGEARQLPGPGWGIVAGGPPGRNTLLAMVSASPRDLSGLGMAAAGPFSVLETNLASTRDIQLVMASATLRDECKGRDRTLLAVDACSDAYGADLIEVEETQ